MAGLIKKHFLKWVNTSPKPYNQFGRYVKVELDLSIYKTKVDLKGVTGVYTSRLEEKSDLANL